MFALKTKFVHTKVWDIVIEQLDPEKPFTCQKRPSKREASIFCAITNIMSAFGLLEKISGIHL